MVPTSYLFALADAAGVAVEWAALVHRPALYVCEYQNSQPVIALSSKCVRTESQLRTLLAHELGHHFTSAGELVASFANPFVRSKAELKANRWAARTLVQPECLEEILRNGGDAADELQVEPWLIEVAIGMYWPQMVA